jgi:hypothetical protein
VTSTQLEPSSERVPVLVLPLQQEKDVLVVRELVVEIAEALEGAPAELQLGAELPLVAGAIHEQVHRGA